MANKKNRTTEPTQDNVEIFPEDARETVSLTDEEGNEIDFYEIAVVEYDSKFFALLQPVEEIEGVEDDEVMIFEIKRDDNDPDNDLLELIQDEGTIDAVFDLYIKAEADQETDEHDDQ